MISFFRKIAFWEGVSSLLLFFVSVPLKYLFKIPEPNYIIGMLHGVLFILYIIYALLVHQKVRWNLKILALVLIAAFLPFATFFVDSRILSKLDTNSPT